MTDTLTGGTVAASDLLLRGRDFDVTDRVVIITGGGQGIGREYARQLGASGAVPVVADLNPETSEAVAAEIKAAGGRALAVPTNVADEASVADLVERVLAEYGRIDALVNNAAIFSSLTLRPFDEIPIDEWRAVLDVNITGKGAHGARPESGIDPVIIATQIISALQSVVSRNVAALDSAVISVTQMHAGDAYNVIPQEAVLRGTIRAFRKETMALVKERIETISTGIAQTLGGKAEADVRVVFPPLVNDKDSVTFIADVAAEIVGEDYMNREGPFVMASEDFSYMLEKVPGAMVMLGNGGGAEAVSLHNPRYDFNDMAIPFGVSFFVRTVERFLEPR